MAHRSLSKHHEPAIVIEAGSPEYIYKLRKVATCIPQLKKTGENFSLWERELKVMLRNLTGSSDYFEHDLHKYHPKLNEAVFSLIFWSIEEGLQKDFMIRGSAGDAFQFLADRFRSTSSGQCIINSADFPEEVLDNIVNMVYHQSAEEQESIKKRKLERVGHCPKQGLSFEVYLGHDGPPVLTTFQNLAVVNRKLHRLCQPKLWQNITFPTSVPAPMSLWTENLLLKHSHLVKSAQIELEDIRILKDGHQFSETERSLYDNTSPLSLNGEKLARYGLGVLNIARIFKACSVLESVYLSFPSRSSSSRWFTNLAIRLDGPFQLIPQLQHLKLDGILTDLSGDFIIGIIQKLPSLISLELAGFTFVQKESKEESLGWNLAQLQKLCKLSLKGITCEDQTLTLKSWPGCLTSLQLICCEGMTLEIAHGFLSGNTSLTEFEIELCEFVGRSDVNVRFDIPALKTLRIHNIGALDLLASFENCKSVEIIEYGGEFMKRHWDTMKDLLSRHNWPKLSLLDVRYSVAYDNNGQRLDEAELEDILKPFNIKVLLDKDWDPSG